MVTVAGLSRRSLGDDFKKGWPLGRSGETGWVADLRKR